MDALDSAEYSESLIILLGEGVSFVKWNMKTRWKKTTDSRIEMPDYCDRSVFESLVNALIHRDSLILGSKVHIDIFDDRLVIGSPGGMADGTRVQERDIANIASTRRNPVLADVFARLGYMERQGSGFKKITEAYHAAHNFRDELEPKFYSDASSFQIIMPVISQAADNGHCSSIYKFGQYDFLSTVVSAVHAALRRTHSIWSAAFSASVTPSCFAIAEMIISSRSLCCEEELLCNGGRIGKIRDA